MRLSPGVNDPFTAINCIDRLGEALCRMAGRSCPSSLRYDDEGQLRVITYPAEFRRGHKRGIQPDPPIWLRKPLP